MPARLVTWSSEAQSQPEPIFAIVLGQLLGYGVTRQASFLEGAMQYKVIFAVQWGFAGVGLAILPFFPE
jgi:hypothetical protein